MEESTPPNVPKTAKTKKSRANNRLVRFGIVLVLGVALLAGGVWRWHSFNGLNEGTVQSPPPTTAEAEGTYSYKTLALDGLTLQYPDYYTVQQNHPKAPGVIDYRVLTGRLASSTGSSQIGITLKALTAGSVQDDSNYRYFLLKTNEYSKTTEDASGSTVTVFKKKTDGFEQVFFVQNGGKLLIVNLSSAVTDSAAELSEQVQKIMQSIDWQA